MLVDLEVFYLGHLKNLYTIQYNTIRPYVRPQFRLPTGPRQRTQAAEVTPRQPRNEPVRCCCTLLAASAYHSYALGWVLAALSAFLSLVTLIFDL